MFVVMCLDVCFVDCSLLLVVWLFVNCCSLFVGCCCLLCVVCCSFFVVGRLLSDVWCLLPFVAICCSSRFVYCCLLIVVCVVFFVV